MSSFTRKGGFKRNHSYEFPMNLCAQGDSLPYWSGSFNGFVCLEQLVVRISIACGHCSLWITISIKEANVLVLWNVSLFCISKNQELSKNMSFQKKQCFLEKRCDIRKEKLHTFFLIDLFVMIRKIRQVFANIDPNSNVNPEVRSQRRAYTWYTL